MYTCNVISQSISPSEVSEFCPGIDITFTVTIPGTNPNVVSWTNGPTIIQQAYNISSSGGITTFNFKGNFRDVNIMQVFRVNYKDASSIDVVYDIPFKKIKSLKYSTTGCSPIQPNQGSITAPRCQISNFNISFNNIQFGTSFETPTLCFGRIATYEYQLPNEWSIAPNFSTGNNWITGGNSVTVTSDLSHGINGSILIRAVNSCGTGLAPGLPVSISILRPAPSLTISEPTVICSGTADYTVSGLPTGATVCWTINSTVATIPSTPFCGNMVTVTKTGIGVATLSATVTDCIQSYPAVTKDIALGIPTPSITSQLISGPGEPTMYRFTATRIPGSTYDWYVSGMLTNPQQTGSINELDWYFRCNNTRSVYCIVTNLCGSATSNSISETGECIRTGAYALSPNPATNTLKVSTTQPPTSPTDNITIDEIRIYDMQGNLKKQQKFSKVKSINVNVSELKGGNYFIEVINGSYKERQQFQIQK